MAQAIIPLDSAFASSTVDIQLGDFPLRIRSTYNDREACWYLDILTQLDELIIGSVKVVGGWELVGRHHKDARLPDGLWIAVDTQGESKIPTRDDLGTRVVLVFDDGAV